MTLTRKLRVFFLVIAVLVSPGFLLARDPAPPGPPSDMGLVTKLFGEVTYWPVDQKGSVLKAEEFMKTRRGDRFKLLDGAQAQLVYFRSDRQETWKGPVEFVVGEAAGQPGGKDAGASPEVTAYPAGSMTELRRIPALLDKAQRYGGVRVSRLREDTSSPELSRPGMTKASGRDGPPASAPGVSPPKAAKPAAPPPTPRERGIRPEGPQGVAPPAKRELRSPPEERIEKAHETYRGLLNQAKPEDITPELYLIGALANYDQYEEMDRVVKEALRKQPNNETLRDLEKWVKAQSSPVKPGQ